MRRMLFCSHVAPSTAAMSAFGSSLEELSASLSSELPRVQINDPRSRWASSTRRRTAAAFPSLEHERNVDQSAFNIENQI
ncbi:hypothetical protein V6N13_038140 [Hibiscus sabdariffa]